MQDEFFLLNLVLKYVWSSHIHIWSTEPNRAKLDLFELDHTEPNHSLLCQIIMCSQKREQGMTLVNWQKHEV
jgi:hypothetical protein